MTLEEFKKLASEATDEYEIDNLALDWLELNMRDNGKEGQIGIKLLSVVKRECMA